MHLSARQRAEGAPLEPGQTHCGDRRRDGVMILAGNAPKYAAASPQTHRHHVVHGDRKGPLDLGNLRQIGDAATIDSVPLDGTGKRLKRADEALE